MFLKYIKNLKKITKVSMNTCFKRMTTIAMMVAIVVMVVSV